MYPLSGIRSESTILSILIYVIPLIGLELFEPQNSQSLDPGHAVVRELKGREAHRYAIRSSPGQFIRVDVEQRGIDVQLNLIDPAGRRLMAVNRTEDYWLTDTLAAVIDNPGEYRIEVAALFDGADPGKYEIRFSEQREATETDRRLCEADVWQRRAIDLARERKFDESLQLSSKAIAEYERLRGETHPDLVQFFIEQSLILRLSGGFDQARPLFERSLSILEKAYGAESPKITDILSRLAGWHFIHGDYPRSRELYERALRIREQSFGPAHPLVAYSLNEVGTIYQEVGDFSRADDSYRQALGIMERYFGDDHLSLAFMLNNIGEILSMQGEFAKAEPYYERLIAIWERAYGVDDYRVGVAVENLARVNLDQGDYQKAELMLQRSKRLYEARFGPEGDYVADPLFLLGRLYAEQGLTDKADQAHRRALEIRRKAFEPSHPYIARSLGALGELLIERGSYDEAEAMLLESRSAIEKTFGSENWETAAAGVRMALLYRAKGDNRRAEKLLRDSITVFEKSLGTNHPYIGGALNHLVSIHREDGRISEAIAERSRAIEIGEFNLKRNLLSGSEAKKLKYLRLFEEETADTISLHARMAPGDSTAVSLAFTTLLRRKGRILDEMNRSLGHLRREADPETMSLFDRLEARLGDYSRLLFVQAGDKGSPRILRQIAGLNDEIEHLWIELDRRSAGFRIGMRSVTIEDVQTAMPAGSALVEFARYTPAEKGSSPRYIAYILLKNGDLKWADLGEAARIDAAVRSFRAAIRRPSMKVDPRRPARDLDRLVMEPVRELLGETRTMFLAPESELNLVPFAALVTERGRYLVEDYRLIHLTSGRDLLRLGEKHESGSEELIFANSRFDVVESMTGRAEAASDARSGRLSSSMAELKFRLLSFAYDEGDAIRSVRKSARVQRDATETEVKSVKRPFLLHIITHGFFLADMEGGDENMLLRSGIVFRGANQRRSGRDDGILTALEVAAMDLLGTKLVVLSACDTGRGEVRTGEGVYGLRRALILAGAESQVTSLWQVGDSRTKDLMKAYYARLSAGEGRAEALRNAQLRMLRDRALRHPHFWAAFIQTGEWANLEGSGK